MELNDAFRRVVLGHWRLLVPFVLLPALLTGWLATTTRTEYVAWARIQASTATIGSDTEADSVLNRVRGVATSPATVQAALTIAQVTGRSTSEMASEITVTRLGSSQVFDITVTDHDAAVAQRMSDALATGVLDFLTLDGSRRADGLVSQLTAQQASLTGQQKTLVAQQAAAHDPKRLLAISSQLSTVDQQLGDVGSTLRQLQVAIATSTSASLVSPAAAAKAVRPSSSIKVALALLAGLVAGLLVAAALEIARPRVSDAASYAREIAVPVLGRIRSTRQDEASDPDLPAVRYEASPETVVAIRHAAARVQAHTVVLLGDPNVARAAELAKTLTLQLRTSAATDMTSTATNPTGTEPKPSSNGRVKDPLAAAALTVGTARGTKTASRARTRPVQTPVSELDESVHVVLLPDLAERTLTDGCAVLVVVADRARYQQLSGVPDLSTATGWPIIGALSQRLPRTWKWSR